MNGILGPTENELVVSRWNAELTNLKPYLDAEIETLQKSVVNSVSSAVNSGMLTPDLALSKWHEYLAYDRLSKRLTVKQNSAKPTT